MTIKFLPVKPDISEDERNDRIREMAREEYVREGEIEVDDNAVVSEGDDNGAYVQAWVWVSFAGTDLDKEKDEQP